MATIRTTIMTVGNPDLKSTVSGNNWFEIEYFKRADLLKQVYDRTNKLKPLPEYVNLQDEFLRTYKCSVTLLHYCFAKGRITEKDLVSMIFTKENRIK